MRGTPIPGAHAKPIASVPKGALRATASNRFTIYLHSSPGCDAARIAILRSPTPSIAMKMEVPMHKSAYCRVPILQVLCRSVREYAIRLALLVLGWLSAGQSWAQSYQWSVSAGAVHSMAVDKDGVVWTWGGNADYQLGDRTTVSRSYPGRCQSNGSNHIFGVGGIAAGGYHTMALTGNVGAPSWMNAWGRNASGQAGNNSTADATYPSAWYEGEGWYETGNYVQAAGGTNHSIAVTYAGKVLACGLHSAAQPLGTDGTGNQLFARYVKKFDGTQFYAERVAAGGTHSLAISGGVVHAWGSNTSGQIGQGTTTGAAARPTAVIGLPVGIVAIAAGDSHCLALDSAGEVWTWGANNYGQCGVGTVTATGRGTATKLSLTGIKAIAAGAHFSIALTTDGRVFTWGRNQQGQLGYAVAGTALGNQSTPLQLPSFTGADAIGCGSAANHVLAIKTDGSIWSWGYNNLGQLGDGKVDTVANVKPPTQVLGLNLQSVAPQITIAGPAGTLTAPANIDVTIRAGDDDGINLIQLFANDVLVASDTKLTQKLSWNGAPAGLHRLHAVVYDLGGQSGRSADLFLNVLPGSGNVVAAPVLSIAAGDLKTARDCYITTATADADIHYTTNGVDPTQNDPILPPGAPVWLDQNLTLKAKAFKYGMTPSSVTAASYRIVGQVVSGANHTLALGFDGSIWSWGENGSGQLGINSTVDRKVPFRVFHPSAYQGEYYTNTIASLESGTNHVVLLKSDGVAYSWGYDLYFPYQIPVIDNWGYQFKDVAAGNGFTVGATLDGRVVGWGKNEVGQLGNGSTADRPVRTIVNGVGGVIDVAAGSGHVIALCADGSVWSWGENGAGQLGLGSGIGNQAIPNRVTVLNGLDVVAVEAGEDCSFALLRDGHVYGWGLNTSRQLGNGTATNVWSPQLNPYLANVKFLAARNIHSAAIKTDGSFWVWGTNTYGQFGDGTVNNSSVPKLISLPEVVSVSLGNNHTAVVLVTGEIRSWGLNTAGQVGDLTLTSPRKSPVHTTGIRLSGQFKLDAGREHSLGLLDSGAIWSWGDNESGQLGIGYLDYSRFPKRVPLLERVVDIAAGDDHSLALVSGGAVFAWGGNTYGELGDGSVAQADLPVEVPSLSNIVAVEAGAHFSLAIDSRGELWFWGRKPASFSQSQYVYQNVTVPEEVTLSSSLVRTVKAGRGHFIGIDGGRPFVWGENTFGQLGFGNTNGYWGAGFYAPTGLEEAIDVAAGTDHCLVLKPDGTVWAWGRNDYGQVGDNTSILRSAPVQVKQTTAVGTTDGVQGGTIANLTGVIAIWANGDTSYAQKTDGSVWVWGRNYIKYDASKFGSATVTSPKCFAAVKAIGAAVGVDIRSISGSLNHTLALNFDGTAASWGDNTRGQLGDPNVASGRIPLTAIPNVDFLFGSITKHPSSDTDNDNVDDDWEQFYFQKLNENLALDHDGDGLTSLQEYQLGLHPKNRDTDSDGFSDGFESNTPGFSPTSPDIRDSDYDGDGLTNFQEVVYGTNPGRRDTDGDGVSDADEIAQGTNPIVIPPPGTPPPPPQSTYSVTLTVGDPSGSESERYNLVVRRMKDGSIFLTHQAPEFGEVETSTYGGFVVGESYSFEVVHTGTEPEFFEENGFANYDWIADIQYAGSGDSPFEIEDPDNILREYIDWPNSTFIIAGKKAYIHPKDAPEDCSPTAMSSVSEASGPRYRKIGIHGLPTPDERPQETAESDRAKEESYVDALTRQLRHSTTDLFIPLVGTELSLSVRRDSQGEVWSSHLGSLPAAAYVHRPFGMGWSSSVSAHIQFTNRIIQSGPTQCEANRPEPDIAEVVDENGSNYRFLKIWDLSVPADPKETFIPFPSNRTEQDAAQTTLKKVVGGYEFTKKFGTKLRFSMTTLQTIVSPGPNDTNQYVFARLDSATDRLGNNLVYNYLGNDTLIPTSIVANGNRSIQITKLGSGPDAHLIRTITDPKGNTYTFDYITAQFTDPRMGVVNIKLLSKVTTPENTFVQYQYTLGAEADWTPAQQAPPVQEYFYFCNLTQLTDANNKSYVFAYSPDHSRMGYSTIIQGYYPMPGQPRRITQITSPTGVAKFQDLSSVRVGYDVNGPVLSGRRALQVTDAENKVRTYEFSNPLIVLQDEFENLLYKSDDPRSTPFLVLYRQMSITHPTAVTEVFEFEPAANMALSRMQDYSGNVTQWLYEDVWSLSTQIPWIPAGYFVSRHSDPTTQINAHNQSRTFKYNSQRILEEVIDEENRKTAYTIDPLTGLRTAERVYTPAGALVQETAFHYGMGGFTGFLHRKEQLRQAADPAWAKSIVTEFTPDAYGYAATEKVYPQGVFGGAPSYVTEHRYDANGNRDRTIDPRGSATDDPAYTTTFVYDKVNRLKETVYPGGSKKQIIYDAGGNKRREIDERNYSSLFEYDGCNRLTKSARDMNSNGVIDAAVDLVTEYTYNGVGSRLTVKNPRGYITTTTYDSIQRPSTVKDALNGTTQYFYEINSGASGFDTSGFKPTRIIDARNYTTFVTYDALYRETERNVQYRTSPWLYALTTTDYDEVGNPTHVWDALNPKGVAGSNAVVTTYDALNRPRVTTYQDGRSTETFYTSTGLKWKKRDERGQEFLAEFDGEGRQVKTISPLVDDAFTNTWKTIVEESVFDGVNNLVAKIDGRGNRWDYTFDGRNRKTDEYAPSVLDRDTGVSVRPHTHFVYDNAGNLTQVTDPRGHVTDTRFDVANRPYEVEQPAVLTISGAMQRPLTTKTFDANGNVTQLRDPNGWDTINTYDALDRHTTTQDPEFNLTTFGYDAVGNRTSVKDGKNNTTTFTYDGFNRVRTEVHFGGTITFEYNELNKTARIDALGRRTEYLYDERHRLEHVRYYTSAGAVVNDVSNAWRTYGYDEAGNITSVTEPAKGLSGAVGYGYDAVGRVTSESSNGISHIYRYDLAGNRLKVTYGLSGRIIDSEFDAMNRLTKVNERLLPGDLPRVTSYLYDRSGNQFRRTSPNGDRVTMDNDAVNRQIQSIALNVANAPLQSYAYIYDLAGNVKRITETYPTAAQNRTVNLVYDKANRLKDEAVTDSVGAVVTTTYAYDAANNRSSKTVSGGPQAGTTTYTHNSGNQVTGATTGGVTAAFTYDANGARKDRKVGATTTDAYTYDYENRLLNVAKSGQNYRYGYDYRTRRTLREEGGVITSVAFSGGTSIVETKAGIIDAEFVRGRDLGGGVGGMLYSLRPSVGLRFTYSNSRGDVVAQTDGAGNLMYQATYEAFGKRPTETGTTADRQKANTKEEDPTGLLNEGFRYRDLETGVFLTRDPAGFVDGPNLYTYVNQNPWSKCDPDGLFWSALVTVGFAIYDTYQVATGQISGGEYAGRMALNGAALVADAATGGMGGGVAVRLAANGSRVVKAGVAVAKAIDKANNVYEAATGAVETGHTIMEAAETGDGRGVIRAAIQKAGEKMVETSLGVRKKSKGEIEWVKEKHGNSKAAAYESGAPGHVPGEAPRLKATDADGTVTAKFDGVDGDVMVDRKLAVTTFPKSEKQMLRQSATAAENGYSVRWEVPTESQARRAEKMADKLGVKNVDVKVTDK